MEWVPIIFITFKAIVLSTGMFFAVKWHYDQGRKNGKEKQREVLRAGGKVVAAFALSVVVLLFITFSLGRMIGLNLTY